MAPTAAPTSSPSGYTDAEQAELLIENVGVVCDARPQPEWCRGFVELTVKDGWVSVITPLTVASAEFADPMCRGIAALAFDDDDESLGMSNVRILDHQGEVMIDCDV